MSQSILVIDTPEKCNSICPCFDVESGKFCNATHKEAEYWNCPLKSIPQKQEMVQQTSRKKMKQNLRVQGFNACVDEILKGENRNE